jgi:transcriptional regulator with XRE-family HTH domain
MSPTSLRFLESKKLLAENLKKLRRSRGLAQEKLALEAQVDRTVVSKIERQIANPSLDILVRLAYVLDVTVCDILANSSEGID